MRVGVLGGGMQGCCAALALSARGADVSVYDREDDILTRTAVANEGKIHLGYMYANDPSLATARMMMTGALAFAPFLERYLEVPMETITTARSSNYGVHTAGQRSLDDVGAYLDAVHEAILKASEGRRGCYFGRALPTALRRLSDVERETLYDGVLIGAAFETPEVAVDPVRLAASIRERVRSNPRIELRMNHNVLAVEETVKPTVVADCDSRTGRDRFDHVVNALWDGRLAVDASLGLKPGRQWLHRLKYGVTARLPADAPVIPSTTIVTGPFGEVVTYDDGTVYLTWYPVCRRGLSAHVTPPAWPSRPGEPDRSDIARETLAALAKVVRPLGDLDPDSLSDVTVKGGVIVAFGQSDIVDPTSGLHQRYEIGVSTTGNYHSVDPGKLTLAPYFADAVADRIAGAMA